MINSQVPKNNLNSLLKMSSSQSDSSSYDFDIVERDPTGQYVRYDDILGEGASKTVYKAFDEVNGNEVAWSKSEISEEILKSEKQLKRLYSEASLLKSLKHENVIRCYHSWVDSNSKTFNMITELFTSGNLTQYRKKHGALDKKAIKNWGRQILKGLDYLHSHDPPIVHRDLKCENIFVNGNCGKVKIGDLGLATALQEITARSVIGTPEFMAPELYEEEYNQLVDVYSFGMCMLQMVTRELPYSECKNTAQVYKKVTSGIKPAALDKVVDLQVRQFIDKCLAPVSERSSATDLLNDPFLALDNSGPLTCCPSLTESVCSAMSFSPAPAVVVSPAPVVVVSPAVVVKATVTEMNVFKLQGKMKDVDSISMTLWIADLKGTADRADFVFFLQTDTVFLVAEEMGVQLKLSDKDAALMANLMEELITELVPHFRCSLAEPKYSSQKSTLPQDELNEHNMPAKEHSSEHQERKELLPPPGLGEYDPPSQSEYAGLSTIDPDISDKITFDQEQKQVGREIVSQVKHCDQTPDNVRRGDKKCSKEAPHKAISRLRKLLCHCGKKF